MKNDLEDFLQDIGRILLQMVEPTPDGILLYSEGERAMFAATIFQDMGDHVLYFFPNEALSEKLFELWDFAAETEKWGALIYTISDGRFDARFEYPDEWDPEEFYDDRCDRIEAEKYGNKRVEYLPRPDAERG